MDFQITEVQNRRAFIKGVLRNAMLGFFAIISIVTGLRRLDSEPDQQVNLLPCGNCNKYPGCEYGHNNFGRQMVNVPRIDDCPDS